MSRSSLSIHAAVLALAFLAPPAAAQSGAFVVRLGTDTVNVERYTRTARSLEGDLLTRLPRTRLIHYVATLGADGQVTRFEATWRSGEAGGPVLQQARMEFGDSVRVTTTRGDTTRTQALAARPGALPLLGYSFPLYELAVRRLVASKKDSAVVDFVSPGAPRPTQVAIHRIARDSVTIDYFGAPFMARIDGKGTILAAPDDLSSLVGRAIDTRGSRATGTILGAVAGALIGREIQRSRSTRRCRLPTRSVSPFGPVAGRPDPSPGSGRFFIPPHPQDGRGPSRGKIGTVYIFRTAPEVLSHGLGKNIYCPYFSRAPSGPRRSSVPRRAAGPRSAPRRGCPSPRPRPLGPRVRRPRTGTGAAARVRCRPG